MVDAKTNANRTICATIAEQVTALNDDFAPHARRVKVVTQSTLFPHPPRRPQQLDRAPPPPLPYAAFYHPTRLTMPNDIVTGRPKDRKQKKQQTIVIGHKHYPRAYTVFTRLWFIFYFLYKFDLFDIAPSTTGYIHFVEFRLKKNTVNTTSTFYFIRLII